MADTDTYMTGSIGHPWGPEKIGSAVLYLAGLLFPNQEEDKNDDCQGNADNL